MTTTILMMMMMTTTEKNINLRNNCIHVHTRRTHVLARILNVCKNKIKHHKTERHMPIEIKKKKKKKNLKVERQRQSRILYKYFNKCNRHWIVDHFIDDIIVENLQRKTFSQTLIRFSLHIKPELLLSLATINSRNTLKYHGMCTQTHTHDHNHTNFCTDVWVHVGVEYTFVFALLHVDDPSPAPFPQLKLPFHFLSASFGQFAF